MAMIQWLECCPRFFKPCLSCSDDLDSFMGQTPKPWQDFTTELRSLVKYRTNMDLMICIPGTQITLGGGFKHFLFSPRKLGK